MSNHMLTAALVALLLSASSYSIAGPCKRGEVRDGKGKCQSVPTALVPRPAPPPASAPVAAPPPAVVASAPVAPAAPPVPFVFTSRKESVVPGRSGYVEGFAVSACGKYIQIPGVGWQTRPSRVEFTTHSFIQPKP